ncbi:uncharacterized protein G6M90_00g031420 [Metarhizium brunneum]|uniref:Uncharacterized protein n=1 Tax=Metarhizium brunneum TaxID=500148 RepID=A0A7D5YZW0_9HYPO
MNFDNTMTGAKQVSRSELKSRDFVPRGNKSSSPFNTTLYLSLRAVDCYWQYLVLSQAYGSALIKLLGGSIVATPEPYAGTPHFDALGLSGYRLGLLAMNVIAAAKHFWFVLNVAEEAWTLTGAIVVGLDNILFDTLNNFLFLCAATSATSQAAGESTWNPYLAAGFALFVIGIAAECTCEVNRGQFKLNPQNSGKPYTSGLFAIVRHPNYTAFTVWRAGLAVATSGATYGILIATFFMWDFSNRAVPALDEYCSKRYGDMWADYKQKTRWTLIRYVL